MDLTLIKRGDFYWDKKSKKDVIFDNEICRLADCGMILSHKIGLRPLYIEEHEGLRFEKEPKKQMEKADLILFSNNAPDVQSAEIIRLQLASENCPIEMKSTDFIEKMQNINDRGIYQNKFKTYLDSFEKMGYKHIVIIANEENLNKMASSLNGSGLNENYTFPIYSFSNGQEVVDKNLFGTMYVTRDLLDSVLLWQFENSENPQFKSEKGKHSPILTPDYLRNKLNLLNIC